MEKLLRILFIISAIAFVTTVAACRLNKEEPSPENPLVGPPNNPDNNPNENPVVLPEDVDFLIEPPVAKDGVTIDKTDPDVVKITINPSLLTYTTVEATHRAPIFTVTFKHDKRKGFIIPAPDTTNITVVLDDINRVTNITVGGISGMFVCGNILATVYGHLMDPITPGFMLLANNPCWLNATFGVATIRNERAFLICDTTVTGINERSFETLAPAVADDLAFGDDTKTECFLNLETRNVATDILKKEARKDWAEKVVELDLANAQVNRNLHPVSFLGIATGDDKASAISKVADALVKNPQEIDPRIKRDAIKKLTDKYKNVSKEVHIIIAPAP